MLKNLLNIAKNYEKFEIIVKYKYKFNFLKKLLLKIIFNYFKKKFIIIKIYINQKSQ